MSRNIIIVGGHLFNKGAQAMVFITVDQIRKRFPDRDVYLFSTRDYERTEEDKNIYNFSILPWDFSTRVRCACFLAKTFIKNKKYSYLERKISEIIKNTDMFIDISGYALSSQWGAFESLNYLLNIIIAKKYSIPYCIMPQSIGPFDYPLKFKILLSPLMKTYLKYPFKIFIREENGFNCLTEYTSKNVEKSYDMVLMINKYNLNNIYKKNVNLRKINIEPNSVGIFPNEEVLKRMDKKEFYSIYKKLINALLDLGKVVYIVRHSYSDLNICSMIAVSFDNEKNVKLISEDLSAIELENIIRQFNFIIASRYHSIVHAYKNGVPAIVIGWAVKYHELLKDFGQLDYFFDCGDRLNANQIIYTLKKIAEAFVSERKAIIDKLNKLRDKNVFDVLRDNLRENRN